MPQHYNQNGGGAKCINLFLFVSTVMFIIDNSMNIQFLKEKRSLFTSRFEEYTYTIDCQIKVLSWISISFFNYYAFIIFSTILMLYRPDTEPV